MYEVKCFVNQNANRCVRILAHYGTLLRKEKALYPTMSQSKFTVLSHEVHLHLVLQVFKGKKYSMKSKNVIYFQCSELLFVKSSWEEWLGLITTSLQTNPSISSKINHPRLSMKKRPFLICGSMKICHCFFLRMAPFHSNMLYKKYLIIYLKISSRYSLILTSSDLARYIYNPDTLGLFKSRVAFPWCILSIIHTVTYIQEIKQYHS